MNPESFNIFRISRRFARRLNLRRVVRDFLAMVHGLFCRKIIKVTGIRGIENDTRYYPSFFHFEHALHSISHFENYDCLVAQNFLHNEFVLCQKPKVYITAEPCPHMTPETRKNLRSKDLKPYLYLYDEPDIENRMYLYCLPDDFGEIVKKLREGLTDERDKLCCIINRYQETNGCNLLPERVRFVKVMGKDIDIYGRDNGPSLNKWKMFPNYYGPIGPHDKIEILRQYNFTIAFESTDHPGYITEKILDGFLGGAVPLYWGGGEYLKETIPSDCYIDCRDQDPVKVYQMIKTMSQRDIISYRKAVLGFLKSAAAQRFTRRYWAKKVCQRLKACMDGTH